MYHKIRITVVSLVVIAMCVLSSVGTLSYFTDTDSATNNFVVGNASTKLAIYDDVTSDEYHVLDASEYTVVANGVLKNNTELPGIPFYLQATNDGNIPVYQRFRVVIPKALSSVVTLNLPTMSENCSINTSSESTCRNDSYIVNYKPSVAGDNNEYAEYYIMSVNALAKDGKTTEWPTVELKIGSITPDMESLFVCPTSDDSGNNCTLGIRAYSDAIQTTGFVGGVENAFASFRETY